MIHPKQTTSSHRRTGVLLILFFPIFFLTINVNGQENSLTLSDLRKLGQRYQQQNQDFLAYIFNLSFYHLSNDSTKRLEAGLDALNSCLVGDRFVEAEQLIYELSRTFPSLDEQLKYKFTYSLLMTGRFVESDILLRDINQHDELRTRLQFLRAYTKLGMNQPSRSEEYLSGIDTTDFPYSANLYELRSALASRPSGNKKYTFVALPLSMIIPGAGQAYSGFYFDALQSFGFNLISGYAAYASWRLELDIERGDRNYIMPIITTTAFGIFYLTNLFNAVNSANRANLYRENQHFTQILDKFRIILTDRDYFLNISWEF